MKIRHDSVFMSSVLWTISLLSLVPMGLWNALAGREDSAFRGLEPSLRHQLQLSGELGVISLTVIAIGLIVTWMGFAKTLRWTWFVMFAIVWGWAYPVLAIRVLISNLSPRWIMDLFHAAIYDPFPQLPRTLLETMAIFVLMLIALLLPIKSFLKGSNGPKSLVTT